MMKKAMTGARNLEDRLDCLGQFDPLDTICTKWCQFNIRCAIARRRHEELATIEDLAELAADPSGLQ